MPKRKRDKYRILNIRGCNGSGKSWIVRELMKETEAEPLYGEPEAGRLLGRIIGYRGVYNKTPIFFVGSYEVMSGGADAVMKHFGGLDKVCELVREFAGRGHVLFEGFIVSGLFSRFYDLSKEVGGITWCYMDTPLSVCYERIEKRNREKGASAGRIRPSAGTRHVEAKFNQAESTKRKFKEEGEEIVIINYKRPMRAIRRVLR